MVLDGGLVMYVYVNKVSLILSSVNPHRAQSKTSNLTRVSGGCLSALCYAMQGWIEGRIWLELDTTPARAKASQRIIIVCIMLPVH